MTAIANERIGVVVVHGVGDTVEGWIDSDLVPQFEKWRAYDSIGAIERKEEGFAQFFSVRAEDRYIAIGLADDDDFRNFCQIAGLQALLDDEDFKTRDARVTNRDELKVRLSGALRRRPAAEWVRLLNARQIPAALAFNAASEVHRVRDPRSSNAYSTWESFTRKLPLEGRDVQISEFYWADLSKVGNTNLTRLTALVQLFLESPYVLGQAFLDDSETGIHWVIRKLIATSNWVMRWPIAGLNVAIFFTAFAIIALRALGITNYLPETIAALLGIVAVAGFLLSGKWTDRKVGLSDLALAASVNAVFLLIIHAYGLVYAPFDGPNQLWYYLIISVAFILIAWILWTTLLIVPVVLTIAIWLKRMIWPWGRQTPPLVRPAAAISLSLVLGMFWKFLLATLGILVIQKLMADEPGVFKDCPSYEGLAGWTVKETADPCGLPLINHILLIIGSFNGAAIVWTALAVLAVVLVRKAGVTLFRERARNGTLRLPRLIANPIIVGALFLCALLNFGFLLVPALRQTDLAQRLYDLVPTWPLNLASTGALALFVFYVLLARLVEMSNGFVHIGRDLVDHQYKPDEKQFMRRLQTLSASRQDRPPAEDGTVAKPNGAGFGRRRRIQARLEALIDEVIAGKGFDRLIFFGHSQGSVIAHDYLLNHNELIEKSKYDALAGVKQIDVITIGSPLTHIYRHYFMDYDAIADEKVPGGVLGPKIKSWTNMYRVDDPIGHEVNILAMIDNVGIGPGGHMDYWKEDPVCAKLWSLIMNTGKAPVIEVTPRAAE